MRKVAIALAALLAVALTTGADAAKKKAAAKVAADPIHEWNKKNMPAYKDAAAAPAKKAAKKGKKKAKKAAKKPAAKKKG